MKYLLFAAVMSFGYAHADEFDFMSLGSLGVGSKIKLNESIVLPANSETVLLGSVLVTDKGQGDAVAYACSLDYGESPRLRRLQSGAELEITEVSEDEDSTVFSIGDSLSIECTKGMVTDNELVKLARSVTIAELFEDGTDSNDPMTVADARQHIPGLTFIPADPQDFFAIDDSEVEEEAEAASEATDAAAATPA